MTTDARITIEAEPLNARIGRHYPSYASPWVQGRVRRELAKREKEKQPILTGLLPFPTLERYADRLGHIKTTGVESCPFIS